jgi:hypothetical protein
MEIYIGTYLECKTLPEKVIDTYKTCKSIECKNFNFNNYRLQEYIFCPSCGKPLEKVIEEREGFNYENINHYQLFKDAGLHNHIVCQMTRYDGNTLFRPASRDANERQTYFDDHSAEDCFFSYDYESADLISNEKEWFKKEFEKEIEILTKAFGENNVRIKWGVLAAND